MTPGLADEEVLPDMWLLKQHAATEERVGDLDAKALLTGSVPMRDIFAAMATDCTWTYSQLHAWLHDQRGRVRSIGSGAPDLDLHWTARLARVIALQNLLEDDHETALRLYWIVHDHAHLSTVAPEHAKLFCDLLLWAGEDILLDELLASLQLPATDEGLVRTDLENPHRGGPRAKPEPAWRRRFAEVARFPTGTALGPTNGPRAFDQLHTTGEPTSKPRATQLVTVIMNVYRPDTALRGAVLSILNQTWDELEVVIVDDGSGDEFAALFDEVAALDERVRLITLKENVGAYGARNVALDHARGTYVAFQDYDDWSLPQRLELQIEPLEADCNLIATRARTTKFYEDLTLAHPGYDRPFQIHAASLLFRRAEVTLGIGYFDSARKGADNEYHKRIMACFGPASCLELPWQSPSLIAYRRTAGSLSRDEFRPGWWHPDRAAYRRNYLYWHQTVGTHELFVPKDAARRFPAPHRFRRERPPVGALDIVIVADVRPQAPYARLATEIVASCVEAGLAVGLHNPEAVRPPKRGGPDLTGDLYGLIHDGQVDLVHERVELRTRLVVVLGPSVLQFARPSRTDWKVGEAWVVAPAVHRDIAPDVSTVRLFLPEACLQAATSRFGVRPLWINGASAVLPALAALARHTVPGEGR